MLRERLKVDKRRRRKCAEEAERYLIMIVDIKLYTKNLLKNLSKSLRFKKNFSRNFANNSYE